MSETKAVTKFFGGGNAAARIQKAKSLRGGMHQKRAKRGSEFPFLGTRNGELLFTYGQDNSPVPEGTLWCVNIATARTGWAYWHKRKKTQVLASIWSDEPIEFEELEDIGDLRDAYGNPIEWGPAYAWQVHAVNGPLKGLTCAYEGTANYMLEFSEEIILLSANRMEDSEDCFPIVRIYNDPYPNADKGTLTSKHKFELFGWGNIEGEVAEEVQDFPEVETGKKAAAAKKPAAKRQRRRSA